MAKPTALRGKWRVRWTDENGERQSAVRATYKEALRELRLREAEVLEIKEGRRAAAPVSHTLGELFRYWLEHRAVHKRSAKHDESIIRAHLRPAFGEVRLTDFSVADVDRFVARIADRNPKTIANILTLLGSTLRLAVDLGWLVKAPRIKKPRTRVFESDFRYLRTVEERDRFLRAAHNEDEDAYALYATAIFTGLRAGELAALEWSHIDLDSRRITVERSFNGPTKGGDVRYVPIVDALAPLLRARRLSSSSRFVFTNRDGAQLKPCQRVFRETLHRTLHRAGFPKVGGREHIRFHDLRHTFASHWVLFGGDIFKLQKILGHKAIAMTMRYAHLAPDAFAADLDRLPAANVRGADIIPLARASS
jgi:integrase